MPNKEEQIDNEKSMIRLTVNGRFYDLAVGNMHGAIAPMDTLSHTLRETLGLTGTKIGCDQGSCGSCTVLMNGTPILSCMTLTLDCDGSDHRHHRRIGRSEDRQAAPVAAGVLSTTVLSSAASARRAFL